jgi:hypothetical protein
VKCKQGHVMKYSLRVPGHECDMCARDIGPSEELYMCIPCNWDLCLACYAKAQTQAAASQVSTYAKIQI